MPAEQLGRPRPDREVAQRLDTLAEVLALTQAPAVVVAAIVQAELLSLDAFAPASGVVARAAARLTLIDRGLDPKSLVAFEVGHLELRAEFEAALAGYRTGDGGRGGRLDRHCARAVELGPGSRWRSARRSSAAESGLRCVGLRWPDMARAPYRGTAPSAANRVTRRAP